MSNKTVQLTYTEEESWQTPLPKYNFDVEYVKKIDNPPYSLTGFDLESMQREMERLPLAVEDLLPSMLTSMLRTIKFTTVRHQKWIKEKVGRHSLSMYKTLPEFPFDIQGGSWYKVFQMTSPE